MKLFLSFSMLISLACAADNQQINTMENTTITQNDSNPPFIFPAEDTKHEGTWLTWPHKNTYGKSYAQEIEYIWVEMTKALATGEKVHIIAYDEALKNHISQLLVQAEVNLSQVDFVIAPSNDVWVRDTGPMFVWDNQELKIVDFGFDGWGEKAPYEKDDHLPKIVAQQRNIPIIDVSGFVLEGGSIELDGNGTGMATRSSVISKNRNPQMSQEQAEQFLRKYLGVRNMIWLDGVVDEDITDAHIDGFARFYNDKTILTVPQADFFDLYENIKESDYQRLINAKNAQGVAYQIEEIPLTKKNVRNLNYRGSYLNFYIGNEVVIVPVYNDENDAIALAKIAGLYPNKRIVPINVVPLFKNGGMIHCVTQQQPAK